MPPNAKRRGITAEAVFAAVVQHRTAIVFDKDNEVNQIVNILTALNESPTRLEVDSSCGARILSVTGWDRLPLVFIKGDAIGGLVQLERLATSNALKNWLQPHQFDLLVIGGGSGGLAAAKEAARLGKKVACLDFVKPSPKGTTWGLGGTCVNVGCIPKKLMHQASLLGQSLRDAKKFGWQIPEGDIAINWEKMKNAIQDHIGSLNWEYKRSLREKSVTYYNCYGTFTDSHAIDAVNKKGKVEKLTADRFLIATGLRPRYPDIDGAKEYCITSDDLFSLPYNPGKTLCIGASYVSLECAGFLHGMGLDVTVMVRSIVLRGFDQDMAERIRAHMTAEGIKFVNAIPIKFEQLRVPDAQTPGLVRVTAERVDGTRTTFVDDYDTVVIAIGRDAQTDDMGADRAGIALAKSGKVLGRREQSRTAPWVYAIGDVLDGAPELTPVAIQAGRVLMRRLFTGNEELTEYDQVPTTVFTPLEYGSCGMAEEDAIAKFGKENINIYHGRFQPLEFTVAERRTDMDHCYCKLVCHKTDKDRVLGFHILTPNAGEITQGFAIALKLHATKADFDRLIGIHPTVAENFTTVVTLKEEGVELPASSGC